MIRKITLLLSVLISLTLSASAATRYVSDDLHTYIHSGPGTKYKIIGSVNAGQKIKVLQTNQSAGFTKIQDPKGRDGWINSKYISRQLGLKERLAKLETKYKNLNTQLDAAKDGANQEIARLDNNTKTYRNQVRELKKTNTALDEELQQIKALNADLNEKLDTKKMDLLMRWFTYGGAVAGIGLLVGLILPSLMPSRRKRNRW